MKYFKFYYFLHSLSLVLRHNYRYANTTKWTSWWGGAGIQPYPPIFEMRL